MEQVLELGEVLRLFRRVGGQMGDVPGQPRPIVVFALEPVRRAGKDGVDLAKGQAPE